MALVNLTVTRDAVGKQLRSGKVDTAGWAFRAVLLLALVLTVGILAILLVDVWTGGWSVLSTRFGDFINGTLSSRAERALAPASAEKLPVAFAALRLLGADYRFSTDVMGDGELVGRAWRGDLYLEDGLHRALRAALQQRQTMHARVLELK